MNYTILESEKIVVNKIDNTVTINFKSNAKWYVRLYRLITNPFTYLFYGIVRY